MIRKIENELTNYKIYSVEGNMNSVVDTNSKFYDLIKNKLMFKKDEKGYNKAIFHIDGIFQHFEGNSHDETDISNYYVFGNNNLWGVTIDVGVGTWDETNAFYYGSSGTHYCENIKKYYITFKENHFIFEPIPKHKENWNLKIYGANDDTIENIANSLNLTEIV
jgi:hypothetical protein